MIFVLVLAIVIILASVCHHTHDQEEDAFCNEFDDHAAKVIASFQENAHCQLGGLHTFSVTVASWAEATNSTWLLFKIPDLEAHAQALLSLLNALSMMFFAGVCKQTSEKCENFAVDNLDWFHDGASLQQNGGHWRNNALLTNWSPINQIFKSVKHQNGEWHSHHHLHGVFQWSPHER